MLPSPTKPRNRDEAYELAGFDRAGREPISASSDRILAQRLATVARILAGFLLDGRAAGARVVIFERGIWPSSECDRLWHAYVEAHRSRFDTSTGAWTLRFDEKSKEDLAALLILIMTFGWGVVAATADGLRAFELDHDGDVDLWGGDPALARRAADEISRVP